MSAPACIGGRADRWAALLVAAALGTASPGLATAAEEAAAPIAPATAHRETVLHGVRIDYSVTWFELELPVDGAAPDATISATAYVREPATDPARPVIFAFNGGPGASSVPLHFGLLGPRLQVHGAPAPAVRWADNPDSLLDTADLVLVDPVGTGFGRELRAGGLKPHLGPWADAKAVEALVRHWLSQQRRPHAPITLIGESYGATRAVLLARALSDIDLRGLVLISPALDASATAPGSDGASVAELPMMAVAAALHGRVTRGDQRPAQVYATAATFARGPYAAALQFGNELAEDDRRRLARRMAAMTGLPASAIAAWNLRIPTQDFLERLLPGRVVGRLDTRVTGPAQPAPLIAGRSKAADDPALGIGRSNVKTSVVTRDYLRDEVGVRTDRDYVSLSLELNFAWDWRSPSAAYDDNVRPLDRSPDVAALMQERPTLRLFVAHGYYDLATPMLATRVALAHAGVPASRTTFRAYAGGHTVYDDEVLRHALAGDLRAFMADVRPTPATTAADSR